MNAARHVVQVRTLNSVIEGERCKKVRNKVKVNIVRSAAELEALVARLEAELEQMRAVCKDLEGQLAARCADDTNPTPRYISLHMTRMVRVARCGQGSGNLLQHAPGEGIMSGFVEVWEPAIRLYILIITMLWRRTL